MPDAAHPAFEKLQALRNHGSKFGVDRMRRLAALIGHPEQRLACIHVAGTNGKGSTCAMIEAIQRAHGRTTGLYTSPHLVRLGERVQINRRPMSDRALLGYCEELFPLVEEMEAEDPELRPSFFELMTATAFLAFAREPVDVAIIEVGLGGRLDATNILPTPLVTVITSIGLDHTDMLGATLAAIAAEKAGILKPGVPLALGLMPPEAEAVIRARAAAIGSPVYAVAEHFRFPVAETPPTGTSRPDAPGTNLTGAHQQANAALAYLACELAASRSHEQAKQAPAATPAGPAPHSALPFNPATALRALQHVDWAGRWQRLPLPERRTLILDVAHNEEGARALAGNLATLATAHPGAPGPVVVVGVLGLDRARPLLAVIARHASAIILVRPDQERACTLDELATCLPADFRGPVTRATLAELFPAPGICTLGAPGDTVVVTGSVYLAGEVLSRFATDHACDEYTRYQDRIPRA